MNLEGVLQKAIDGDFLTLEEGVEIYTNSPLAALMFAADQVRTRLHPGNLVGWIIDRNINYTNICISGCQFCNFYRSNRHKEGYITTIEQYRQKIDALFARGGDQILLQGGMHPELGLEYYTSLFRQLKELYPRLKLHALGPPEIVHISQLESISYRKTLGELIKAGLDSLPGAGAEILSDRVRSRISKNKCSVDQWLEVMRQAHILGLTTSATMMFGHVETIGERVQHMIHIRDVQNEKPAGAKGFLSFIPWPFQDEGTTLQKLYHVSNSVTPEEYVRTIALSRLMLPNIPNIQASCLTVGKHTAQLCLHAGANDFGSIMIEENVVSMAGANYSFDENGIQQAILEAGFVPKRRNQQFEEA